VDFIPDKEFHKIFDRVSKIVDLKGADTPQEVNRRLNQKIKEYPPRISSGWISFLKRLIFAGFSRRVIDQTISQPYGLVGLTLKHGRERARHILLARARRRLGSSRYRKRLRRR
jgi:hypothetical protein